MKTYKQLMLEMAMYAGKAYSPFEHKPENKSNEYDPDMSTKIADIGNNISLHKTSPDENTVMYKVHDHNTKECLYRSKIIKEPAHSQFPIDSIQQYFVDRVKNTDRIPKGFALNHIYTHFDSQPLPLRSSSDQYTTGHNMWRNLVDHAMNKGKHAYFYKDKTFTKITPENKTEMLNRSFGKLAEYQHIHLVLSHEPIN